MKDQATGRRTTVPAQAGEELTPGGGTVDPQPTALPGFGEIPLRADVFLRGGEMPRKQVACRVCGEPCDRGSGSAASPTHNRCMRLEAVEHGTRRSYRQRGCKCAECRAWAASSVREYAARYRAATGRSIWSKYRRKSAL